MSGDRPPAPGRQGAEAAHEDAAADFARMLEEIRAEGAVAFDAGMRELWWSVERVDPVDPPGGVSAEAAGPYAAVSDQRLADFGGMAAVWGVSSWRSLSIPARAASARDVEYRLPFQHPVDANL